MGHAPGKGREGEEVRFTIIGAPQRSPEWFAARVGRLTGSCAFEMLDVLKDGKTPGYKRKDLMARLVCERLTGQPQDDGYVNAVMQRGIDMEPDALAAYEGQTGNLVRQTGFIRHDSLMVGCSVDGDIHEFTGILEIKCPKPATHLSYLRAKRVPENHMPQVLHNLWVTGAQWCDFFSYDPRYPEDLQTFYARVPRVEIDVLAYAKAAEKFLAEVDAEVEAVQALRTAAA